MNILSTLAATTWSWSGLIGSLEDSAKWEWVLTLMDVLSTVLWVLLALVGAAGGIYALYVGIKMARADSAEQREENKKRLINIIVSIVVVVVLILFFNTFLPAVLGALGVFKGSNYEGEEDTTVSAIKAVITTARCLIGA